MLQRQNKNDEHFQAVFFKPKTNDGADEKADDKQLDTTDTPALES